MVTLVDVKIMLRTFAAVFRRTGSRVVNIVIETGSSNGPARGYRNRVVKVLVVIDSLEVGTPGQLLPTLARAAASEQVELEVAGLHPASGKSATTIRALGRAGESSPVFSAFGRISDLRSVQLVADAIRTSRCEVVHAHHLNSSTLVPVAARLAARPSVCTLVQPAAAGWRSGRAQGTALRFEQLAEAAL